VLVCSLCSKEILALLFVGLQVRSDQPVAFHQSRLFRAACDQLT
jgi:hypothetical protein